MSVLGSVLLLQFFIACAERDNWGVRVKRTIPKSRLLKPLAFLFYSGSGGGMLYGLLLTLITGGVVFFHLETYGRSWDEWRDMDEVLHAIWLTLIYGFCFTATAMLIRNLFFRNKFDTARIPMIAFMLVLFGSIFPYIMAYVFDSNIYSRYGYRDSYWWLLTNPFYAIGEATPSRTYYYGGAFARPTRGMNEFRDLVLMFSTLWAALALVGNLPGIIRQWRRFKSLDDSPVILEELEQEAVMGALPIAEHWEAPEGIQEKPNYE